MSTVVYFTWWVLGSQQHSASGQSTKNDFMKSKKKYFHELFRQTMNRFAEITDAGYNLIYCLAAESQGASAPGWIAAFD